MAVAASQLFRHESVITRSDLLRVALVEAGLESIGIAPVYAELQRLEEEGTLLRLGPARDGGRRWTTPSIAAVEAAMLRSANRPAGREWITERSALAALERAPHLSDEQRDAVRRAASPEGISVIEAGAGTGKTTAARAIADAAHAAGLRVVGLAPSWVAADELEKSVGIDAQAIAKWRSDDRHGHAPPLDADTMVFVDEAGMVSMRDMAAVTVAAMQAGAKVVLLGDSRQLEAVPGGSALRAVTEVVRQNAVMEAVRRQEVDWQRAASVVMAHGDAEAGLRAQPPRVVHAYAGTAYSVQGRTTAASVHHIGVATDAREVYVALTRHRQDVSIVVERDRLDAACRQRQADSRMRPTATAVEQRLFAKTSQYGEKANVVDFVADRQHFMARGLVTSPEERIDRRASKLLEAARAVCEALTVLRSRDGRIPLWRLLDGERRLVPPLPGRLSETILHIQQTRDRRRLRDREPTIER